MKGDEAIHRWRRKHHRRMTDSEGDPGPTINLDYIGVSVTPTSMTLHRAAADAQHGLVWIAEGGQRIAAVVSKEAAESLARLRSTLLAEDCEDFEPFFDAIKALGKAHAQPHFGNDEMCQCPHPCCTDGKSCLCLECSCEVRDHRRSRDA
jgi:hypothetical protein